MSSHLKPQVSSKDHIDGSASAPIELVEYGDFECPHCGAAYPIVKKIQKKLGSELRFVFRNFPLSDAHPFAFAAAVAAEAAALQGRFWEMHDTIFENQRALSDEGLFKMAAMAGLDLEKFKNDVKKEELKEKVEADFESGIKSGVNGTPSFYINGAKFNGGAADLFDVLEQSIA